MKTVFNPFNITTVQQYILIFLTFVFYTISLFTVNVRTELILHKMTQSVYSSGNCHHIMHIKSSGTITWSYTYNCFLKRCEWKTRQKILQDLKQPTGNCSISQTQAGKGLKNTFSSLTPAVSSFLRNFKNFYFILFCPVSKASLSGENTFASEVFQYSEKFKHEVEVRYSRLRNGWCPRPHTDRTSAAVPALPFQLLQGWGASQPWQFFSSSDLHLFLNSHLSCLQALARTPEW